MSESSSAETPAITAPELFSLKGKNALITGGSRGIGAAIALALAQAGASICIAQRDTTNTSTRDKIKAEGGTATIVPCDLSNMNDVKALFQRALDTMNGTIDVVVNCGGSLQRSLSTDVSEEEWDYVRKPATSKDPALSTTSDSAVISIDAGSQREFKIYLFHLSSSGKTHASPQAREDSERGVFKLLHRRRASCFLYCGKRSCQSIDKSPQQ